MSGSAYATEQLIQRLVRDLPRVRRLGSPLRPFLAWVAGASLLALLLCAHADGAALLTRLRSAPDMWLALVGSVGTALAAAAACFLVSRADRSPQLAWLALPPLLLWLGASGAGCLRPEIAWLQLKPLQGAMDDCLPFILVLSVPLYGAMVLLLRPAATVRPELCALTGGLAVAATSASLLTIVHPFDAGAAGLLVHAFAVAIVVLVIRYGGGALLRAGGE